MIKQNYSLTIGWLYPALMSTYGDRGNILVLQKRAAWRGIKTEILEIDEKTTDKEIEAVDLLFGGGAQDREQEIVMRDLMKKKAAIKALIEKDKPALFVCGAPQLMGAYYEPGDGKRIEGLGIFDMHSKHPGGQDRLIGNVIAEVLLPDLSAKLVGFENHGGRTHLGKTVKPFAKVLKGFGNNGSDGLEGVVYKNALGSYLHGPLLPKNPEVADWLLSKALEVKYGETITLDPLDDLLEKQAKDTIAKRLGIAL